MEFLCPPCQNNYYIRSPFKRDGEIIKYFQSPNHLITYTVRAFVFRESFAILDDINRLLQYES